MCSFIIMTVSVIITRLEFCSESVRLLATTMKPRDSDLSSVHAVAGRNCRRGWPVLAPNW